MDPDIQAITDLIYSGRKAGQIMEYVAEEERLRQFSIVKRNDPCPCGSKRKYKKCCGAPL
jgi:uncharacterized protein YecA (UPF0149 family)